MEQTLFKTYKRYSSPPLAFWWNKKYFLNDFLDVLKKTWINFNSWTIIDLFWGSWLLSHNVKRAFPACNVIYNDFDNYSHRLEILDKTEILRKRLFEILKDYTQKAAITAELKKKIFKIIREFIAEFWENNLDINTLNNWLVFSWNFYRTLEIMEHNTLYNRIKKNEFEKNIAENYLEWLKITNKDYRELIKEYKNKENVLFLFDPPYLNTNTAQYKSDAYWTISDYLEIILYLQNKNFFFFTSNKSASLELIKFYNQKLNWEIDYKMRTRLNHLNYWAQYLDIMLYFFK